MAAEDEPKKPTRPPAPFADLDDDPPEVATSAVKPAEKPNAPAAAVVEQEPDPAAAAKPTVAHRRSATVLRAARQLGVSEARIAASTPDQLDALTEGLLEQRQAEYEQAEAARNKPAAVSDDFDEIDFGKDAEGNAMYDEDFTGRINAGHKKVAAKIKELDAKLAAIEAAENKRAMESASRAIDKHFETIDSPLLGGKARWSELDPNSDEMFRRNQIIKSLVENPIKGKSQGEQIAIRARQLLGVTVSAQPAAKPTKKPPTVTEEQWAAGGVARPTGTKVPETETGERAARAAVKQLIAERGTQATKAGIVVEHEMDDDEDL